MIKSKYDREQLMNELKRSVVEVTFTKVNGEQRIMHATLDPRFLPQNTNYNHLEEQHAKPEHVNIIACWDMQAQGWRSFRVDSVIYCQELSGIY